MQSIEKLYRHLWLNDRNRNFEANPVRAVALVRNSNAIISNWFKNLNERDISLLRFVFFSFL